MFVANCIEGFQQSIIDGVSTENRKRRLYAGQVRCIVRLMAQTCAFLSIAAWPALITGFMNDSVMYPAMFFGYMLAGFSYMGSALANRCLYDDPIDDASYDWSPVALTQEGSDDTGSDTVTSGSSSD